MNDTLQTIDDIRAEWQSNPTATRKAEVAPSPERVDEAARDIIQRGYLPRDAAAFRVLAKHRATRTTRGVFLTGEAGTGKTAYCRTLPGIVLACGDIARAAREHGPLSVPFWYALARIYDGEHHAYTLCLDDLGSEPASVVFGERSYVLVQVVESRHSAWERHGTVTHITSNLTPAQIDARYGRRVTDRLRAMCVHVELRGGSAR